jgi:hypothetical protein
MLAFFNFAAFFVVALMLGGDALNGKIEDGRYYLANHGRFTEVSSAVWHYSRAHVISVLITHPLGILGGGGLMAYANRKSKRDER